MAACLTAKPLTSAKLIAPVQFMCIGSISCAVLCKIGSIPPRPRPLL